MDGEDIQRPPIGDAAVTRRDREGCRVPVYSTPRNPKQHARRLVRLVDWCDHGPLGRSLRPATTAAWKAGE